LDYIKACDQQFTLTTKKSLHITFKHKKPLDGRSAIKARQRKEIENGKRQGKWVDTGTMNKLLNFGGDPDHHMDTWIVFRIRHYWEIRKVVSTDCAARRCTARHALAGIAIATMTSIRHRSTTDSGIDIATLVRHALAEVCAA